MAVCASAQSELNITNLSNTNGPAQNMDNQTIQAANSSEGKYGLIELFNQRLDKRAKETHIVLHKSLATHHKAKN